MLNEDESRLVLETLCCLSPMALRTSYALKQHGGIENYSRDGGIMYRVVIDRSQSRCDWQYHLLVQSFDWTGTYVSVDKDLTIDDILGLIK